MVKDAEANIIELKCSYLPESRSGGDSSGLKVKGTLHWVSVQHAIAAEVRLYDRLFTAENVDAAEGDFKDHINPDSLQIIQTAYAEPAMKECTIDDRYQFIRKGYFCLDKDSNTDKLIFNRTVTLKDAWAKEVKKN